MWSGWLVLLSLLTVGSTLVDPTDIVLPSAEEEYERIVIPFPTSRVQGRFGTTWLIEGFVFNASAERITLSRGRPLCTIPCEGGRPSVGPGLSRIEFGITPGGTDNGRILYTNRQESEQLTFHLRLSLETEGGLEPIAELPVVREREFRSAPIELLDIPNEARRRVTVRIYDLAGKAGTFATVRVYPFYGGPLPPVSQGPPLVERVLPLEEGVLLEDPAFPQLTGYSQIALSDLIPFGGSSPERVRIEVTSGTPDAMLWAFASITDNSTQRVSLVTPQ